MLLLLSGCSSHQDRNIQMEAFSDMKTPEFVLDIREVRSVLHRLAQNEAGTTSADQQVSSYYQDKTSAVLWLDRYGFDHRVDSLLSWLHLLYEEGLSEKAFGVDDIERDLRCMRTLDLTDSKDQHINTVAARLEYELTKACLKYCKGQRYGFMNPHAVFNSLDAESTDSLHNVLKYRELYDIKTDLPTNQYFKYVQRKIKQDSIAAYLREVQPTDRFYGELKKMLAHAATTEQKSRIIINMERARWRVQQRIPETGKRIIVNIPAYHLYAYGMEENLDMKVVCGNVKTKTPQLTSNIEWMELNPQWVIPFSIIKGEVAHRAGDTAYFARNKYHIYERKTNKEVSVPSVTRKMLESGNYRVAQEGGPGNSLGRIIFRFKNRFSVFLHDTSNPGAFERSRRAMSHGCVRVAKPFDLACFVLDEPDEWLLDRMRIAMGLPAESEQGMTYEQEHPDAEDRYKLINYVKLPARVPIYIIYYTLWPDADGVLQTWPDVYGYDEVIWKNLKPYL